MPKSAKQRAFTLVELLVVIGIIAVLMSVLLPTLGRARESAKRVACASNMRQIGLAVTMYCNDNKGWLPVCVRKQTTGALSGRYMPSGSYGQNVGLVGDPTPSSFQLLAPPPWGASAAKYVGNADIFFCPSDDTCRPYRSLLTASNGQKVLGWGYHDIGGNSTNLSMSYWYWYYPTLDYPGTASASKSGDPRIVNDRFSVKGAPNHSYLSDQGYLAVTFLDKANVLEYPFFHKDGWNVLFLDGHVRWVRIDEILPALKKSPSLFVPANNILWNQL